MKIPLLEGRDFRPSDDVEGRQSTVAIVNRRFAEHFFPGGSAVGKRLGLGRRAEHEADDRDHRRRRRLALRRAARRRAPPGVRAELGPEQRGVLRADATPASAGAYGMVRNEVQQLDAAMPVYEMKTVEGQLDETLLTDRLIALLSAGFGLLATLLASIGLYGVMAFVVARRRKELGIRLALGAQPRVRDLAGDARSAAAAGDRAGRRHSGGDRRSAATSPRSCTASRRTIRGSPAATVLLLTLVSAAAGLIPAHRASRIDPILALRTE